MAHLLRYLFIFIVLLLSILNPSKVLALGCQGGSNIASCSDRYVCTLASSNAFKYRKDALREATRRSLSCAPKVRRSVLHNSFRVLSVEKRKNIQSALSSLGMYTSNIDGLYGKGTAAALNAYNKEYLANADLNKKANVETLFANILTPLPTESNEAVKTRLQPTIVTPEPETVVAPAVEVAPVTLADMQEAYDRKDYLKAREAAEALAIEGEADAQFLLGKMYAEGLGTLQISKTAHMWFNIASFNGSAEAITERNAIAETMTASAVENAQELALKCVQSKYSECGLTVTPKQTSQLPEPIMKTIVDGAALRNDFKTQSSLRRKQLQYALKKLGVYSSSIDGLWGNGTSMAFSNYIKINALNATTGEEVFSSVLSKVKVPTSFLTKPKQSVVIRQPQPSNRSKNTAGLKAIVDNPPVTGAQAKAICEPQAKLAGKQASDAYRSPSYGSSVNCSKYGYSINCRVRERSGGYWGGVADGVGRGFARSDARKATMKACLAQYGWKQ